MVDIEQTVGRVATERQSAQSWTNKQPLDN